MRFAWRMILVPIIWAWAAQAITMLIPSTLSQCSRVQLTWKGGYEPFVLRIGDTSTNWKFNVIREFPNLIGQSMDWTIDMNAGSNLYMNISDRTGAWSQTPDHAPPVITSGSTGCMPGQAAPPPIQNTNNQGNQNNQGDQSNQGNQNTQNTQNTQTTQNAQNNQNTQTAQNNPNTQNNQGNQNTQVSQSQNTPVTLTATRTIDTPNGPQTVIETSTGLPSALTGQSGASNGAPNTSSDSSKSLSQPSLTGTAAGSNLSPTPSFVTIVSSGSTVTVQLSGSNILSDATSTGNPSTNSNLQGKNSKIMIIVPIIVALFFIIVIGLLAAWFIRRRRRQNHLRRSQNALAYGYGRDKIQQDSAPVLPFVAPDADESRAPSPAATFGSTALRSSFPMSHSDGDSEYLSVFSQPFSTTTAFPLPLTTESSDSPTESISTAASPVNAVASASNGKGVGEMHRIIQDLSVKVNRLERAEQLRLEEEEEEERRQREAELRRQRAYSVFSDNSLMTSPPSYRG